MDVILIAVIVLGAIGLVSALVLFFVSKKFAVKEDPRIAQVSEVLPQANCGGCGFPGCGGFASALVEGGAKKVSQCRPSKPEARQNIKDYLASTPGPDGNTVNVDL